MGSFCCPYFDEPREWCRRAGRFCVPGRPGCVLRGNSTFLEAAEERIRAREQEIMERLAGPGEPAPKAFRPKR